MKDGPYKKRRPAYAALQTPLVRFTQGRKKIGPGEGHSRRQVIHPSIPCPSLPAVFFKPALNSFSKTHTHGVFCLFSGELGQLRERAILLSRR